MSTVLLGDSLLATAISATLKIGVFGLFHPAALEIRPADGQVLMVDTVKGSQVLERGQSLKIEGSAKVTGRGDTPVAFILSVPGKIEREFFGKLKVYEHAKELIPVVEIDRETAVAAILASELFRVPREALKAQAVAVRSYLAAAKSRHEAFDFCDTTHCQFMRERQPVGAASTAVAAETKGQVLVYQGRLLAALYSADCGGHTRTLQEAGWGDGDYPYFGVACPVKGERQGHGIGLCQMGAIDMARQGATFRQILAHYFPATSLADVESFAIPRTSVISGAGSPGRFDPFVPVTNRQ